MLIPVERIQKAILVLRGKKVMLDRDLAELYGVPTKSLNLAVKRNPLRFPPDMVFRLTPREFSAVRTALRFQFETSKTGRGGRRYPPYAFTEHGAIMLASVLNSGRAIEASLYVVRAFVKLRELLSTHRKLADKLRLLESHVKRHDDDIIAIVEAIRQLMSSPPKVDRQIGFRVREGRARYLIRH